MVLQLFYCQLKLIGQWIHLPSSYNHRLESFIGISFDQPFVPNYIYKRESIYKEDVRISEPYDRENIGIFSVISLGILRLQKATKSYRLKFDLLEYFKK